MDVVVHISLADLLKDLNQLEDKELKYVSNVWTYVDFVIFNKMDKKMVIAVEVDGYERRGHTTKYQSDYIKLLLEMLINF